MGSLRSLRSAHSYTKTSDGLHDQSEPEPASPQTPNQQMPSLALGFEVSPPNQPMFTMRKMSSSSSMVVQRSSPITVPVSAGQPAPTYNTPSGFPTFEVGTVPQSPAPLQRVSVQEAILSYAADGVPDADSIRSVDISPDPLPTPMPGTHLPLEDVAAPEIVVSSPSAASIQANILHSDTDQGYFSAAVSKESTRQREESLITTDELDPAADAEIVAMLAMGANTIVHYPPEASSGRLDPVHSDEAMPLRPDDAFTLDSPTREISDDEAIGGDLACIVWDDPAMANEDKSRRGHGSSVWSRHQDSHASTSNHTEADTEATDLTFLTFPDEECPHTVDGTDELVNEAQVSADDRETLQDIIRAYAGPMLYHEEAEAHHACEHSDDFAEFQAPPLEEVTSAKVKAEVEDSIRVMNRSLGG